MMSQVRLARKERRRAIYFSPEQRERLERYYATRKGGVSGPKEKENIALLSRQTGLSTHQIRGWLRNRKVRGAYKGKTVYHPEQIRALEWLYVNHTNYPTSDYKMLIANRLGMTYKQVKKWYQSRRQKEAPSPVVDTDPENWSKWAELLSSLQHLIGHPSAPSIPTTPPNSPTPTPMTPMTPTTPPTTPTTPTNNIQTIEKKPFFSQDLPIVVGARRQSPFLSLPNTRVGARVGGPTSLVDHEEEVPRSRGVEEKEGAARQLASVFSQDLQVCPNDRSPRHTSFSLSPPSSFLSPCSSPDLLPQIVPAPFPSQPPVPASSLMHLSLPPLFFPCSQRGPSFYETQQPKLPLDPLPPLHILMRLAKP